MKIVLEEHEKNNAIYTLSAQTCFNNIHFYTIRRTSCRLRLFKKNRTMKETNSTSSGKCLSLAIDTIEKDCFFFQQHLSGVQYVLLLHFLDFLE